MPPEPPSWDGNPLTLKKLNRLNQPVLLLSYLGYKDNPHPRYEYIAPLAFVTRRVALQSLHSFLMYAVDHTDGWRTTPNSCVRRAINIKRAPTIMLEECLYKFKVVNVMPDSRAKNIFCVTTPLEHFTRYTSMSVKRSFDRRQPWISVSSILTTE